MRYDPILARVIGTDHQDIYVRAGDPIGFRNMCAAATSALLGSDVNRLGDVGASLAVEVFIIPHDQMTDELRRAIKQAQIRKE